MNSSSVGGHFLKAQVQNHYEKVRCDLHIKDISKRHVHSLTNINKSIKEAKDTLRDIQATSGSSKDVQGNEAASKWNVWKEREWSTGKSQPNDGDLGRSETQARWKTNAFQEIKSKDLDSGERRTIVDGIRRSSLFPEKNERNVLEKTEYFVHGKKGAGSGNEGCEMNGDRSDIVPAGRLLRDEVLMLADSRNVSGRIIKGPNRQGMDSASTVKEPQGKSQVKSASSANGSNFQNTDATSAKLTGKSLWSPTSRTDDPPASAIGSSKLGKSRPNTGRDGLMGSRSQTAPAKASHLKSAKGELKKNSSSRFSSANDVKKVKIHVSLSRTERKRLLRELISSCAVPCDRSALERQRQRLLQEKIHRFFELLFEQDDKYDKDDGSDIFGED